MVRPGEGGGVEVEGADAKFQHPVMSLLRSEAGTAHAVASPACSLYSLEASTGVLEVGLSIPR